MHKNCSMIQDDQYVPNMFTKIQLLYTIQYTPFIALRRVTT